MKTLEEKKLLVKMARMFGQPVDPALVESIEKEEKLAKLLFKEETKEEIIGYEKGTTFLNRKPIVAEESIPEQPVILTEVDIDRGGVSPPVPPKEVVPPTVDYLTKPTQDDLVKQTMKTLSTNAPKITSTLERKELEGIKRTLAEMMQKIGTLTWGGGGTGIVKIWDADDLDRSTAQNGRFMKYQNGIFVLDEINPFEIIHNTTLVTSNSYVLQEEDYYIGVNYPGPVTIIIPSDPSSGREIVVKDESGNCETHNITISGPIDNDANGAILAVNNGALHMLFRGNYWRII